MFSPYYAWARRRGGGADPQDHCAMNLALYGPRGKHWAMTERGRGALKRDSHHLGIGPSQLYWDGDCLTADIDEVTVPLPSHLCGSIRLVPEAPTGQRFTLDPDGQHHWWPIAPRARVEVEMVEPNCRWQGSGYFDCNAGGLPLEESFERWNWSRAHLGDGGAALLYDTTPRHGAGQSLALRVAADGKVDPFEAPPAVALPATLWRVARATQADPAAEPRVLRTLEDAPFYARSLLSTRLHGAAVTALHESLDLDRFRLPLVQVMLPFRMPRRR